MVKHYHHGLLNQVPFLGGGNPGDLIDGYSRPAITLLLYLLRPIMSPLFNDDQEGFFALILLFFEQPQVLGQRIERFDLVMKTHCC